MSCVVLEALCDLMLPTLMSRIIDDGVRSGQIGTIVRFGLLMLLITAFGSFFAASRNILASRVSQSFGADHRKDIFRKIMNFSEESADRIESGSLIARMTNDASQITQFINGLMRIFVKAPVMCIGSIVLAAVISPAMSPILLAAVAAVTTLIAVSMKLSYTRFARVQTALDRINLTVQEYLLGIRLVKAFGRFDDELGKFDAANSELSRRSEDSQLVIAWFSPLITLTVNTGIAAIIFTGSALFGNGSVEVGKISALMSYMAQILSSLLMITNVFNMFVRTKASTARIREVMESGEDYQGSGEEAERDGCGLEFRDVTFAYPNGSGVPAIKRLSFAVGKGETVAVIGPTGSGKSTLAWLCLRFYDAGEGSIRINGRDIRTLDRHKLRDLIAIVPQKSALFSGTVFENGACTGCGSHSELMASCSTYRQIYDSQIGEDSAVRPVR